MRKNLRGLFYLVLVFLLIASQSYGEINPETIVGIWLLNEGQGKTANDLSKNGREGKLIGSKWVEGKFGKALDFNGKDEYVEVIDSKGLDAIPQITVVNWVKFNQWPKQHYSPTGKEPLYRFIIAPGGNGHFVVATTGNAWYSAGTVASGGGLITGQWQHLAGTYDGKFVYFYVDGKLAGKGPQAISGDILDNASPFHIAKTTANNVDFYEGIVDDVGIFNVALSETDIKNIMAVGLEKAIAGNKSVSSAHKISITWARVKITY